MTQKKVKYLTICSDRNCSFESEHTQNKNNKIYIYNNMHIAIHNTFEGKPFPVRNSWGPDLQYWETDPSLRNSCLWWDSPRLRHGTSAGRRPATVGTNILMLGSLLPQHEATGQACTQPLAKASTVCLQTPICTFYLYPYGNWFYHKLCRPQFKLPTWTVTFSHNFFFFFKVASLTETPEWKFFNISFIIALKCSGCVSVTIQDKTNDEKIFIFL